MMLGCWSLYLVSPVAGRILSECGVVLQIEQNLIRSNLLLLFSLSSSIRCYPRYLVLGPQEVSGMGSMLWGGT